MEVEVMKKTALLWYEIHLKVKMLTAETSRRTFGNGAVQKVHLAVARCELPSRSKKATRFLMTAGG